MTDTELSNKIRRDFFAASAMNALIQSSIAVSQIAPITDELIASRSYAIADAMIAKGGPIE
jgi:hypothetical protein